MTLLNNLNALDIVEIAYPVPQLGPDPQSPDFENLQRYRAPAPQGVGVEAANSVPGGSGENVQIIDIERFFDPNHEDLPEVTIYENGDPFAAYTMPFSHGTAVLGQMVGLDNGRGVTGIAPGARAGFVTLAGGRASSIDVAAANSSPGDVILLEVQVAGPLGCSRDTNPPNVGCLPMEYHQASYDAIVTAVADGIIVVEAAGNGYQNLDDPMYADTLGARPDSGAIMVGAGASGEGDCRAPARTRLRYSNFGSRVNLQGWGECVVTLGYGTLSGEGGAAGQPDSPDAYTDLFSGTSSASPIVAAAAAVLSSVAIERGDPDGLSSTEARALLVQTGIPQPRLRFGQGQIGPQPNLTAALGLQGFFGPGRYRLENVDLARYLWAEGDKIQANVATLDVPAEGTEWDVIDNGDGTWLLQNVATGGWLDGDDSSDAWNVDLSADPAEDDRWLIEEVGVGEWALTNAVHGRFLDADRDHQSSNVDLADVLRGDRKWAFRFAGDSG